MEHCPRVLSLDGGGVRGLSSLLILKEIMAEIGRSAGSAQDALPCEYFDLIGGTSTGGLIALMLGRLRMVTAFSGN
jgi:patatin-like phospholipase/acyl hydrolase